MPHRENTFTVTTPSDLAPVPDILRGAEGFLRAAGKQDGSGLLQVLRELLVNAIVQGSRGVPERSVKVEVTRL